jgi:phosphate transport system substrate-binding protein
LTYALHEKLPMASIKNPAGKFAKADLNTVTEAAAQSLKVIPDDFKVSLTNAPGANS